MSKFSDQLNRSVKLSGKSKNQIIDESRINRSSFFQFLNGKRMPTKEHLNAILATLQLTPGEEEHLRRLYEIAEIGENIYESRQGCAECLEDLALLTEQNRRPIHEFVGEAVHSVSRAPILGENRVYQELCHLAQAEMLKPEPQIDLFLPRKPNEFIKYLKSFMQNNTNKKIRMRQVIQFSLNDEEKTKDILKFFNSLIFLMATSGDSYEAYYYYSNANMNDAVGVLYPYCVMTSGGAMLLSAHMDRALFSAREAILVACQEQFEEAVSRAKPFLEAAADLDEFLSTRGAQLSIRPEAGYQYFSVPCLGNYLPEKAINFYRTPALTPLIDLFQNRIRQDQGQSYVSFCMAEGILEFAQTGIFPEFPVELLPPIAPKARRLILEEMLYRPIENKPIYLLDSSKVKASNEFIFMMVPKERVVIQRRQEHGMRSYVFHEKNLINAFTDFFEHLKNSDAVLPRRDLNQVLLKGIEITKALEEQSMSH